MIREERPAPRPPRPTVRLEGELAARYRRAAASLGATLEGDVFDVDRAGMSAPLKQALAAGVAGVPQGAAVWILCSVEQSEALHGSERFSFEQTLLDRLYLDGRPFLERVTATDAAIVTVKLAPAAATRLEELGVMESVRAELGTAGGSLSKLTELVAMNRDLQQPDNYLSRAYLQRMVELAAELNQSFGSLADLSLPVLELPITAFCAPALGSVYYFNREPQDLLIYPPPYRKPDLEQTYQGLALPVKLSSPHLTQKLHEMEYLRYDLGLIPLRLEELENENLLTSGIDPGALSPAERGPAVSAHRAALPRTWHELNGLAALARRKEPPPSAHLAQLSEEVRIKLSVPVREVAVVSRLLSDLDHIDYPRFHAFNRTRFAAHFADYTDLKKRYVWQRICRAAPQPAVPPPGPPPRSAPRARDEDENDDIRFIDL